MHGLADRRRLEAAELAQLGASARSLLSDWAEAGWVRVVP